VLDVASNRESNHVTQTVTANSSCSSGTGGGGGYPESPHPYSNNYDNTWTYTLPANATAISVTFDQQTQVESGYDYIYVMDGSGNNIAGSPFTGNSLAGQTKTVPGNTVKIRLTSDYSVVYFGFRITNIAPSSGGSGGTQTRRTVFLIHGIAQSGGAMDSLGITLRDPTYGIDRDRFGIDAGFDYGDCADTVFCASSCTIPSIAQRLGQYIRARNPDGDIILLGYSLGGLVARDLMLNNYYGVLDSHRVAALITLGTPNVGYPYSSIDNTTRCPVLVQQMASDYRARQSDNIVVESDYLYSLNNQWGSTSFVGQANHWLAVAGTCCTDTTRYPGGPGCQDNTRNDGVVCEASAAFRLNLSGNLPTSRWSDPNHQYSHTGGFLSWFVLDNGNGAQPLYNPIASGELMSTLRSFFNGM
jgi:pimeloyl-ACP methyl ester carboxylesterase